MSKTIELRLAKSLYAWTAGVCLGSAVFCLFAKYALPHFWGGLLDFLNSMDDNGDETDVSAYLFVVIPVFLPVLIAGLTTQFILQKLRITGYFLNATLFVVMPSILLAAFLLSS